MSDGQVKHDYVFLIGAAKCGTTALADMLHQHPDICLSNPKEPDFFTNRIFPKGFSWYEECFFEKPEARIRLDASVSYSAGWGGSSEVIAKRIYDFSPDSKILYIVREPIARTWSAYWHAVRNNKEPKSFRDSVSDLSVDHITASNYLQRIDDYLKFFPKDNFRIIEYGEVANNAENLTRDIFDFIGASPFELKKERLERRVNTSYQFSPLGKWLMSLVSLDFIKSAAFWANRHLPESFTKFAKSLMSKPVPEISDSEVDYLRGVYATELDRLKDQFGVDLKKGKFWQ